MPPATRLLIEAARRIRSATADARLVARSGGDEFAVVMAGGDPAAAAAVTGAILAAFQAPFVVADYSVTAGISIGSAEMEGGRHADELIRRADVAMYAAKAAGKNIWCAYHRAMDDEYDERRRLEHDLRLAIERGHIRVEYQPVVNGRGQVVGTEALARWTHPRHGPIPPDIFIRVAERCGLISDLGRSVLLTACREARDWDLDLAVNLSPGAILGWRAGATHGGDAGGHGLSRPPAGTGDHRKLSAAPARRGRKPFCATCAGWASASRSTISAQASPASAI